MAAVASTMLEKLLVLVGVAAAGPAGLTQSGLLALPTRAAAVVAADNPAALFTMAARVVPGSSFCASLADLRQPFLDQHQARPQTVLIRF